MLDRVIAVVSKTQTSKHQSSKTQISKLQTPWKTIEIVNAVLHECIYFFTIIIIDYRDKPQVSNLSWLTPSVKSRNNPALIIADR